MLDSISYDELIEWSKAYEREPWGEWRIEIMLAQVCAIVANSNRDPKKRGNPYTIDEFMLLERAKRDRKKRERTGNLDNGLFDAFMRIAGVPGTADDAAVPDALKRAAPHLSPERLAQISQRITRDGV